MVRYLRDAATPSLSLSLPLAAMPMSGGHASQRFADHRVRMVVADSLARTEAPSLVFLIGVLTLGVLRCTVFVQVSGLTCPIFVQVTCLIFVQVRGQSVSANVNTTNAGNACQSRPLKGIGLGIPAIYQSPINFCVANAAGAPILSPGCGSSRSPMPITTTLLSGRASISYVLCIQRFPSFMPCESR